MTRPLPLLAAAVVLAGTVAACPPVRAAPSAATVEAQARARYDQGIVQYALGDLAGAIESWTSSYALVPTPALLFNMGQAYRLLGDSRRALSCYRTYLRQVPDAPNGDEVAAHIATLEASEPTTASYVASGRSSNAPPAGTPAGIVATQRPVPIVGSRRALIAGIAGSAVAGAVSIGVGVGFSVRARRAADAIESAPANQPWSDVYGARYDDGRRSAAVATAFYVIGGAALAGSAIIAAVGRKTLVRRSTEPSRPILSAASLRWAF